MRAKRKRDSIHTFGSVLVRLKSYRDVNRFLIQYSNNFRFITSLIILFLN